MIFKRSSLIFQAMAPAAGVALSTGSELVPPGNTWKRKHMEKGTRQAYT
jgi:hypothetical protein